MRRNLDETALRLRRIGVFVCVMLTALVVAPMAGAQTQGREQKAVEVKDRATEGNRV